MYTHFYTTLDTPRSSRVQTAAVNGKTSTHMNKHSITTTTQHTRSCLYCARNQSMRN